MITIVLMLTLATMTIVIEVMIAIVRMIVMDAYICIILNRMMPTSWYWEPLVTTRGHTEGTLRARLLPIHGLLVFFEHTRWIWGPNEVAPHSQDSDRPPFQLERWL